MEMFKCKMCGGELSFEEGATVAECTYCGTKQTLPKLVSDQVRNLYDRANHLRRSNEYDKAMDIYEKIVEEDSQDAEAYWSLVLCRYGIEYVEDPESQRRIPTINRVQYTSIYADADYQSALEKADENQKKVYEAEAKIIDSLQKEILAISKAEKPFDVFICYKETDREGSRTPDSVLANDLYYELTEAGYKVFFSRITLEAKIGAEYEPYIFAALNSAKVMVVLGTRPEYFNAVWVKNEWSRFLTLIKSGHKKTLVPAYRDMDPYDLPEEFSHLQAQDMSKLGFMQDLIRGIKKIIGEAEPEETVKETVIVQNGGTAIEPLLKRLFMFLEDGLFDSAEEYGEQVLNMDPECAAAYIGKLMAKLKIHRQEELGECEEPLDGIYEYQKALRFADEELKETLSGYNQAIHARNEQRRLEEAYHSAEEIWQQAETEAQFRAAADAFRQVPGFRDADEKAAASEEKATLLMKENIYRLAADSEKVGTISEVKNAIELFESIPGWKDADEKLAGCRNKLKEMQAEQERRQLAAAQKAEEERKVFEQLNQVQAQRSQELAKMRAKQEKKTKRLKIILFSVVAVAVLTYTIVTSLIIPYIDYKKGVKFYNEGQYEQAVTKLDDTTSFMRSDAESCLYKIAEQYLDNGQYAAACKIWVNLGDYKDSKAQLLLLEKQMLYEAETGGTVILGQYEQDGNEDNAAEPVEWIVLEKQEDRALLLSKECLDKQQYSSQSGVWRDSSVRKWLNNTFINKALLKEEAEQLISYHTEDNTEDKIFLLSQDEAAAYLSANESRRAQATEAALKKDIKTFGEDKNVQWWLRTSVTDKDARNIYVSMVNENGYVVQTQHYNNYNISVRPVMWVRVDN